MLLWMPQYKHLHSPVKQHCCCVGTPSIKIACKLPTCWLSWETMENNSAALLCSSFQSSLWKPPGFSWASMSKNLHFLSHCLLSLGFKHAPHWSAGIFHACCTVFTRHAYKWMLNRVFIIWNDLHWFMCFDNFVLHSFWNWHAVIQTCKPKTLFQMAQTMNYQTLCLFVISAMFVTMNARVAKRIMINSFAHAMGKQKLALSHQCDWVVHDHVNWKHVDFSIFPGIFVILTQAVPLSTLQCVLPNGVPANSIIIISFCKWHHPKYYLECRAKLQTLSPCIDVLSFFHQLFCPRRQMQTVLVFHWEHTIERLQATDQHLAHNNACNPGIWKCAPMVHHIFLAHFHWLSFALCAFAMKPLCSFRWHVATHNGYQTSQSNGTGKPLELKFCAWLWHHCLLAIQPKWHRIEHFLMDCMLPKAHVASMPWFFPLLCHIVEI